MQALDITQDPASKYIVPELHLVQAASFPPSLQYPLTQSVWQASQIFSEFITCIFVI